MSKRTSSSKDFVWDLEEWETFDFLVRRFDVRAAKRVIVAKPRKIVQVKVHDLEGLLNWIGIHKSARTEPDLDFPIILATIRVEGKNSHLPIDGWHRISVASRNGVPTLPAVILTKKETDGIMR